MLETPSQYSLGMQRKTPVRGYLKWLAGKSLHHVEITNIHLGGQWVLIRTGIEGSCHVLRL